MSETANRVVRRDRDGAPLVVTRRDTRDGVCLQAAGEIDVASVQTLVDHLRSAIVDRDDLIVVDLGDVTFMGVCGVNALISAHQTAPTRVRLGTLHPAVRRVLELTTQLNHFGVINGHPSPSSAAPVSPPRRPDRVLPPRSGR